MRHRALSPDEPWDTAPLARRVQSPDTAPESYEAIPKKKASIPKDSVEHYKYVIVGGGIAGGYAAHEFVRQGIPKGQVLLISAEAEPPYERAALSKKFLQGLVRLPQIYTCAHYGKAHDDDWYEEHGVRLLLCCRVIAADFANCILTTDIYGQVTFEKCLLATGATPIRLDIPGADLEQVYYLRSLEDAEYIVQTSQKNPTSVVAVLGSGYLAMEAAASLVENGHKVTMIYPSQHFMSRLWTRELAGRYEEFYQGRGVSVMPGTFVEEILPGDGDKSNTAKKLRLSNGEILEVEFIVSCIGATVPKALVDDQLEIEGRGVKVNLHMQTSLDHVYAVGDLCSFYVKSLKRVEVMEHAKHARLSAAQAVRHMVGTKKLADYEYHPWFYSKMFSLAWEYYGDPQGTVYVGCSDGDCNPGVAIKCVAVWASSSGRINGIHVESPDDPELDLVRQVTATPHRVDSKSLQSASSYRQMMTALLRAQPLSDKEAAELAEKSCALSKAEVARLLQKLPQKEYAYLASRKFESICRTTFQAVSVTQPDGLHGTNLRDAVCQVLLPHQADVVYIAMEKHEQRMHFLENYGGQPCSDCRVHELDFFPFVRFCLAWCIWRGYEVSQEEGVLSSTVQSMQNVMIEDMQTTLLGLSLSRETLRHLGRIVRKHLGDHKDFLAKYLAEVQQVQEHLQSQESMQSQMYTDQEIQLRQAKGSVEELKQTIKDMQSAHATEMEKLKGQNGLLSPEPNFQGGDHTRGSSKEEVYSSLDYLEKDTRELVATLVSTKVREMVKSDEARELLKFQEEEHRKNIARVQADRQVLQAKVKEQEEVIVQLKKDIEALQDTSALNSRASRRSLKRTSTMEGSAVALAVQQHANDTEEKLKTRETEIQEIKTELQELLSLVTEDSPYSHNGPANNKFGRVKSTSTEEGEREESPQKMICTMKADLKAAFQEMEVLRKANGVSGASDIEALRRNNDQVLRKQLEALRSDNEALRKESGDLQQKLSKEKEFASSLAQQLQASRVENPKPGMFYKKSAQKLSNVNKVAKDPKESTEAVEKDEERKSSKSSGDDPQKSDSKTSDSLKMGRKQSLTVPDDSPKRQSLTARVRKLSNSMITAVEGVTKIAKKAGRRASFGPVVEVATPEAKASEASGDGSESRNSSKSAGEGEDTSPAVKISQASGANITVNKGCEDASPIVKMVQASKKDTGANKASYEEEDASAKASGQDKVANKASEDLSAKKASNEEPVVKSCFKASRSPIAKSGSGSMAEALRNMRRKGSETDLMGADNKESNSVVPDSTSSATSSAPPALDGKNPIAALLYFKKGNPRPLVDLESLTAQLENGSISREYLDLPIDADQDLPSILFFAVGTKNEGLVKLLCDHGANPHLKFQGEKMWNGIRKGMTALEATSNTKGRFIGTPLEKKYVAIEDVLKEALNKSGDAGTPPKTPAQSSTVPVPKTVEEVSSSASEDKTVEKVQVNVTDLSMETGGRLPGSKASRSASKESTDGSNVESSSHETEKPKQKGSPTLAYPINGFNGNGWDRNAQPKRSSLRTSTRTPIGNIPGDSGAEFVPAAPEAWESRWDQNAKPKRSCFRTSTKSSSQPPKAGDLNPAQSVFGDSQDENGKPTSPSSSSSANVDTEPVYPKKTAMKQPSSMKNSAMSRKVQKSHTIGTGPDFDKDPDEAEESNLQSVMPVSRDRERFSSESQEHIPVARPSEEAMDWDIAPIVGKFGGLKLNGKKKTKEAKLPIGNDRKTQLELDEIQDDAILGF